MSSSGYCNWGICNSQEYCCGDNVCCKESNFVSNVLFLTAIIFGIIVLMCCCVYIYCNSRRIYGVFLKRYFKISYNLMSTPEGNGTGVCNKPGNDNKELCSANVENKDLSVLDIVYA